MDPTGLKSGRVRIPGPGGKLSPLLGTIPIPIIDSKRNSSASVFGHRRWMAFHVQSEMVGARERRLADPTDVRFVSGMLAVVTTQLVGAREAPVALRPSTAKRLFT